MNISPEMILLVINLTTNIMVLLKRIKIFWTPCIAMDCRTYEDLEKGIEEENDSREHSSEETSIFRKVLNKLTPRTKNRVIVELDNQKI